MFSKLRNVHLVMVAQAFNSSTREAEAERRISELEANLVYRVSLRASRATPTEKPSLEKNKQSKTKQNIKAKNKTQKPVHSQTLIWFQKSEVAECLQLHNIHPLDRGSAFTRYMFPLGKY